MAQQHYRFAFGLLRGYAFQRTAELQEALWNEPEAFLPWLWQQAAGKETSLPATGLAVRTFLQQGQPAALITLPEPQDVPDPYFVLILFDRNPPGFYSLEKSSTHLGGNGTVLGFWEADRRSNLGEGPGVDADADAFLASVLATSDKK